MEKYNPQKIEQKWRSAWAKTKAWNVDLKKAKHPYYNLMMFPYPSAEGLHVGNVYAFTGSDIHGRFKRMQGFDVFEPMGFDSFGIHSENFAIKKGVHPKTQTASNIAHFTTQLKALGALFDWDHKVVTSDPDYYTWTQWLFVQLYKAGFAYKAKAPVDWCPSCKTVLADEQVIDGKCERCGSEVIQKELEQWFFRITKYADRLLKNLDWIDWTEKTKIAQRNWIGKSEGAQLRFPIAHSSLSIEVFTTRPDTLFGATYMVLAPEHPLVEQLKDQIANWGEVVLYREKSQKKTEIERTELAKEKTGVELKGVKAVNPANKIEIRVFVADYVLASYGTGAIMAVPAHDARDFEFAKKYGLDIKEVVRGEGEFTEGSIEMVNPYTGEGFLVNSSERFNLMESTVAKKKITEFVGGILTTKYHLRDWLISRQRYWGPPIPIIYCPKCGTVPVPEKDLPVKLPFLKNYRPEGTGRSPLSSVASFVKTKCPKCKGKAERETDVSDTFLDSAWYFFRYPSTRSARSGQVPFDPEITRKWLPVDMYIGGHEHAVLHLLYTRFITMALHDLGYIDFEEPFKKFRAHGLITKEGAKMSKSKGNVVNPDEYVANYGADTVRMYLMFIGPLAEAGDWSDKGIVGISRFLHRVWNLVQEVQEEKLQTPGLQGMRARTIKKVKEDMEGLRYNTAIAALMEYSNEMSSKKHELSHEDVKTLLVLLAPFAPYISEELWSQLKAKGSVHSQQFPVVDETAAGKETIHFIIQVNGRVRDVVDIAEHVSEEEAKKIAFAREKVAKFVDGKTPKRIVFVPGKLLNIVV